MRSCDLWNIKDMAKQRLELYRIFCNAEVSFAFTVRKMYKAHIQSDGCLKCYRLFQTYQIDIETSNFQQICAMGWLCGLHCLFFFTKYIRNYKKFDTYSHWDIVSHLEQWRDIGQECKAIIVPRKAFKTSLVCGSYIIREIVKNPNIRILIYSSTTYLATEKLSLVRDVLNDSKIFRGLYGNFTPKAKSKGSRWSLTSGLQVSQRTEFYPDPTVSATGIDASTTGGHYDIIVFDDLQNEDNCRTAQNISWVISKFRQWTNLLNDDGKIIVIGTPWNYNDVLNHVKKNVYFKNNILIKKAYEENPDGSIKRILFPKIFTRKNLFNKRLALGEYMFNCQIQLTPQRFNKAMLSGFKVYQSDEFMLKRCLNYAICIDPAAGGKGDTADLDYCGIVKAGVTQDYDFYVIETINERLDMYDLCDVVLNMAMKDPYTFTILVEDINFQRWLKFPLEKKIRERNIPVVVIPVHAEGNPSKIQRARQAQGYFNTNKVFVKDDMDELITQLKQFPYATGKGKDDLVDALVYLIIFSNLYSGAIMPNEKILDKQRIMSYKETMFSKTGY